MDYLIVFIKREFAQRFSMNSIIDEIGSSKGVKMLLNKVICIIFLLLFIALYSIRVGLQSPKSRS